VVCSSDSESPGGQQGGYVAYQNAYNNWTEVDDTTPLVSDGIGLVRINNIWNIAVSNTGATYLYWNPLNNGQNPRTTTWPVYSIGAGAEGNSVEGGMLDGVPTIFECANETGYAGVWPDGCVMFQPNGTNYTGAWKMTEVDSSYADVHEINAVVWPQGQAAYVNGVPALATWLNGFVVGEQEQASTLCNGDGLHDHTNNSLGCRVTYFSYNGNGTFTPIQLSDLGSHNQSVEQWNGELAVAGLNHGNYDPVDHNLNLWLFNP
jgi:hypothetical protein